jgi:signal transduction histidine kinase
VPEYVEILQEIAAETRRLGVIVNDLFTLARADAGERRVIRQPFFLDDTVLEAANEAGTRATLSGVRLDVKELEEAPVDGDPRLVHQLMSIVLDNAIKYTAPGGEVSLSVTSRAHRSVVIVEDTGIGIPATALSHIYDRFYRADSARPIADGAGLGLSIARWIADVHSANLTISSEPGRGTRVEISFPAGQQNEEQSGGERRPLARVNSGDSDAGGSPVTTVTVV